MSLLLLVECCEDSGCPCGYEVQFSNFMCNPASSNGLGERLDIGEFDTCCHEVEIASHVCILVILRLWGECLSEWAKCMRQLVDLAMRPCGHEHHSGIP